MDQTNTPGEPVARKRGLAVSGMSDLIIGALIAVSTSFAYWPVRRAAFINLDDPDYVSDNPVVQQGLTWSGLAWAFTTGHASNWHPLTWLSHMADCSVFGLDPAGPHIENVVLHVLNAVLLYWLLRRATGRIVESGFVGALFALHPAHVESVAWVSERKDLLSALFWMLCSLAYVRWVEAPSRPRYVLVVALFALGLLCKPMLVTLPFALILLDFWPLSRLRAGGDTKRGLSVAAAAGEKLPLFGVAVVSAAVTFLVQRQSGAVAPLERIGIGYRVVNALVAYGRYLSELVWPARLGAFYPMPDAWPLTWVASAGIAVGSLTALAWWSRQRRPYLLTGWLFFAGTLVPVLGLVQVGSQSMADRYTYIPFIGLFVMIVWALGDLARHLGGRRIAVVVPGIMVLAGLLVATQRQASVWIDNETLFRHTLAVSRLFNVYAHYEVGVDLLKRGDVAGAKDHFDKILERDPANPYGHVGMGTILARQGRREEAAMHFEQALRVRPNDLDSRRNLAQILADNGRDDDAMVYFAQVVKAVPGDAISHLRMGRILAKRGDAPQAIIHLQAAVEASPREQPGRRLLAVLLTRQHRGQEAAVHWMVLRRGANDDPSALVKIGTSLAGVGLLEAASEAFGRALQLAPADAPTHVHFATVALFRGRTEEALQHFAEARRLRPADAELLMRSGAALAGRGQIAAAAPYLIAAAEADEVMTTRYLDVVRECARTGQRQGVEALLQGLSEQLTRWRAQGKGEQASRAERELLLAAEELGVPKESLTKVVASD